MGEVVSREGRQVIGASGQQQTSEVNEARAEQRPITDAKQQTTATTRALDTSNASANSTSGDVRVVRTRRPSNPLRT